jgi:Protein of unknown function DUF2625
MDAAWDEVQAAAVAGPYPVEVLSADPASSVRCLAALGFTRQPWLGAVVAHPAGLLVDHGWLRVLGSGGRGLPDVVSRADPKVGRLVVAHDVLGGLFIWMPAAPQARPTVHYFGPDDLGWQDLGQGYADWLYAVLHGSLTGFYDTLRWPGWEAEVAAVELDHGIHTWPPPWTAEGKDLSAVARKPIPIGELIAYYIDTATQLGEAR